MQTVLDFVAKHEGFAIPEDTVSLIAADAGGNLRKAILVLEALKMQKYALSPLSLTCMHNATVADPHGQPGPVRERPEHRETRLGDVLP